MIFIFKKSLFLSLQQSFFVYNVIGCFLFFLFVVVVVVFFRLFIYFVVVGFLFVCLFFIVVVVIFWGGMLLHTTESFSVVCNISAILLLFDREGVR